MVRSKSLVLAAMLSLCSLMGDAEPACDPTVATGTVVPGLEYRLLCRGEASSAAGYRVRVGVFEHQSEADAALERVQKEGLTIFPESRGEDYWLVSPTFPQRQEAEALAAEILGRGVSSEPIIEEVEHDLTSPAGPWRVHVLEVDPKRIEARVAHAYDAAIGLETTAELAARRGALAAVNGGYFRMEGLLAGDSRGVLKIDGKLLSEPDRGRAAIGFADRSDGMHTVFGRLSFRGEVRLADGGAISVDGLNRPRQDSEVVVYTPEFHRTTLTPPTGVEVVIERGLVVEIRQQAGSNEIPDDGWVLSVGRERAAAVLPLLRSGARASLQLDLVPLLPDPDGEWGKAEYIIGGGPLLLWQGRQLEEPEKESLSRVFFYARHPRTAVGVRADGTLLFVVVDGRRPGESVGMSIPELGGLMADLGCRFAVNLDGGGSSTMVIGDEIANIPSGAKGPRRNGDAILLFRRSR